MRAMELNNVAVSTNQAAFEWGRHCAHDWAAVQRLLAPAQAVQWHRNPSIDELVAEREAFLVAYQSGAYARRYRELVDRVREAEGPLGKTTLSQAVAKNLFKLMAYKDEYEVARLHTDPAFVAQISSQFEGNYRIHHHLAPPLWASTNARGELQKQKMGAWVRPAFAVLKHLKFLRGTVLDVFGHTHERRTERALIDQYRQSVEALLKHLNAHNHALAVDMANVPEQIKGFGHVKARHLAAAQQRWNTLKTEWERQSAA